MVSPYQPEYGKSINAESTVTLLSPKSGATEDKTNSETNSEEEDPNMGSMYLPINRELGFRVTKESRVSDVLITSIV